MLKFFKPRGTTKMKIGHSRLLLFFSVALIHLVIPTAAPYCYDTGRGVARNTDLGGPGCNRNIPNIIFKSIGYKIINFHRLLYT